MTDPHFTKRADLTQLADRLEAASGARCRDCIMLAECSYEFGAHPDDLVCTGFREPLRAIAQKETEQ